MKALLKKYISSNILLYYIWFKIVRKRKGLNVRFFGPDTDLYIDAYPRSGNTFIIHLIRNLLPKLNVVHHLHVVAPIKIAFLLDLPVFIIIRNPMECISSKYLKHFAMRGLEVDTHVDDDLVNQFILDYLTYYKFVKSNLGKISIIDFGELIETPETIIKEIKNNFDIEKELSEDKFNNAIQSYRGATNTMGSSRPNAKKEKYKSIVKKHIAQSDKHSELVKLYNSIINEGKL